MDIFCPVIPVESRLLEEKIGCFTPKTIPWNYGSSLNIFDNNIEYNNLTGNNILVGNSATPTNNHAEVFKILYDLGLPKKTKIFVPLSYGSSEYRDKIIQLGYEYFGDQFVPITNFMNLTEYFKLIQQCSVMIMNHRRQQGAGNIGLGLYVGAKIFLNKVSPLYQFYTDKKAIIYSCDQITTILSGGISPLSKNEFISNHQLLEREHGRKKILNNTRNLLKEIQRVSLTKE
ncbi:TDP-N-acetylfucosamine:lipid II N-acetylfucosaminyltransferase [Providencia sp. PROV031]|uniref:TDP-N-acetylfucosamine:lipid II N-acetylfucosaminyltransferase n=1 Tax=Providencia sp. PROV031 TaxID=2949763 RepID=UPI00300EAF2C